VLTAGLSAAGQLEGRDHLHQLLCLRLKPAGGGSQFLNQGGVLLHRLVDVAHGLTDLGDTSGLLAAARVDKRNVAFWIWGTFMPAGIAIALVAGPALEGWRPFWMANAALARRCRCTHALHGAAGQPVLVCA